MRVSFEPESNVTLVKAKLQSAAVRSPRADGEVTDAVGGEVGADGIERARAVGGDGDLRRAGATAEAAGSAVQSDRVAAGKAQSTVIRQRRGRLDQDGDVGPNAQCRRGDREVAREDVAEVGGVGADGVQGERAAVDAAVGVDVDVLEANVVGQVLDVVVGDGDGLVKMSPVRSPGFRTLALSSESSERVNLLLAAVRCPPAPTIRLPTPLVVKLVCIERAEPLAATAICTGRGHRRSAGSADRATESPLAKLKYRYQ